MGQYNLNNTSLHPSLNQSKLIISNDEIVTTQSRLLVLRARCTREQLLHDGTCCLWKHKLHVLSIFKPNLDSTTSRVNTQTLPSSDCRDVHLCLLIYHTADCRNKHKLKYVSLKSCLVTHRDIVICQVTKLQRTSSE